MDKHCTFCKKDTELSREINGTDVQFEEIEFYCRSCKQAVCRNCLLKNHLKLDLGGSNSKQEKIKEK